VNQNLMFQEVEFCSTKKKKFDVDWWQWTIELSSSKHTWALSCCFESLGAILCKFESFSIILSSSIVCSVVFVAVVVVVVLSIDDLSLNCVFVCSTSSYNNKCLRVIDEYVCIILLCANIRILLRFRCDEPRFDLFIDGGLTNGTTSSCIRKWKIQKQIHNNENENKISLILIDFWSVYAAAASIFLQKQQAYQHTVLCVYRSFFVYVF
jgi:hypothetical protein